MEKYGRLYYAVRRDLGLSWLEYVYLDMVHQLSRDRWCNKSINNAAEDLGVGRMTIIRAREHLQELKLLEKDREGQVRTSVTYAKRLQKYTQQYQNGTHRYQNGTQVVPKRENTGTKTVPKNNKRFTGEKGDTNQESSSGYALARKRYEDLKARRMD